MNPRHRPLLTGLLALAFLWALALGGYWYARNSRMTAEKVRQYLVSVDLRSLQGEARARAIRELVRRLNSLSWEERQKARLGPEWARWLEAMTDEEQAAFIEATLPAGFKQALTAFEELPETQRRRAIDEAVKRLREVQEELVRGELPPEWGPEGPPMLSEEVRQRAIKTGLKTFYAESSGRMKAELAPLLEEMQRMMERGALLRRRWEGAP